MKRFRIASTVPPNSLSVNKLGDGERGGFLLMEYVRVLPIQLVVEVDGV